MIHTHKCMLHIYTDIHRSKRLSVGMFDAMDVEQDGWNGQTWTGTEEDHLINSGLSYRRMFGHVPTGRPAARLAAGGGWWLMMQLATQCTPHISRSQSRSIEGPYQWYAHRSPILDHPLLRIAR
ncbi:hypothetical protein KIN20_025181 [Parelaphostrongylus tenuis]|uniref:Uncharacterized protein n=1 Tax=Parelaphostrongylus tenuis TaxID=148309 RepID=A0AAD5NAK7_PARTN|nr:hypothetical protein KIN20_025181 [Parelaphostrongylus tenuis]